MRPRSSTRKKGTLSRHARHGAPLAPPLTRVPARSGMVERAGLVLIALLRELPPWGRVLVLLALIAAATLARGHWPRDGAREERTIEIRGSAN